MGTISDKFRRTRLDQTPYLFHFTKGTAEKSKESLYSILNQKKLISKKYDFVCFSASPITSIHKFFETKVNSTNLPMYQPFGIGFSRDLLIKKYGARNVFYCNDKELESIPDNLKWRVENLNVDTHDFEYLREWRIKGKIFDFEDFPKEQILIIAPHIDDVNDLVTKYDLVIEPYFNEFTGNLEPDVQEVFNREYKGLSLDEINKICNNDYEVSNAVSNQIINQDMTDNLRKGFEEYLNRMKASSQNSY